MGFGVKLTGQRLGQSKQRCKGIPACVDPGAGWNVFHPRGKPEFES